jgi:hypothetical protein
MTAGTGNPPAPALTRVTLRADVTPQATSSFTVPLVIADALTIGDQNYPRNVVNDKNWLIALHDSQRIFPWQDGLDTHLVKMTDYQWVPTHRSADVRGGFCGTFIALLRHIRDN